MKITYYQWVQYAISKLKSSGIEESDSEPIMILAYLSGLSKGKVLQKSYHRIPTRLRKKASRIISKRIKSRKPLAYILGIWDFYGLEFDINKCVMIPRPETELLVNLVLSKLGNDPLIGLDIGTGAGNIAISLLYNRPKWRIIGTDESISILKLAKCNAKKHNVLDRFFPICCNLMDCISEVDFIVTNPPYIPSNEIKNLSQEVQCEPLVALDGGKNGVETIKRIYGQFIDSKAKFLAFEFGYGQANQIRSMTHNEAKILNDYKNIPRIAVIKH